MRLAGALLVASLAVACTSTPSTGPDATGAGSIASTIAGGPSTPSTVAPATAATTAGSGAGTVPNGATPGGLTCWTAPIEASAGGVTLEDATEGFGLVEPLTGIMGHAGAWADVNGDLLPDLFVGTFADRPIEDYQVRGADGPGPDRVLVSDGVGFVDTGMDAQLGRTSGAVFADLDLDGDPDLVLARNPLQGRERSDAPSTVYRNDDGVMVEVADAGLDPGPGGRSIGVLDIDQDGLADLVVLEDRWTGGSSVVYRNLGDLRFEDATAAFGFPDDVHGLGVATGDLNGDGLTDVVIGGSNRVFAGTGSGLAEVFAGGSQEPLIPAWEIFGDEDDVAGVSIADVNLDGLPDLVLGQHYNSTLSGSPVPIRLYLNRTGTAGDPPVFEDVTTAAGLVGLPTKAPHVEFVDLDNDGLVDILTSASAGGGTVPAVFRNTGVENGLPIFEAPSDLGSPQYWVALPTADLDRDGRVDMIGIEWFSSLPSPFFHNISASGHWLEVSVDATLGGGPGTVVTVYEAGGAGDPEALLGHREIVVSQGYSAGNEAVAHFGLGDATEVDVVVSPPPAFDPITLEGVVVDQHLRLPNGC